MIFLLNKLKSVDITFMIIVLVAVAIVVGVYFLVPLINKKRYEKQREALKEREKIFKENLEKNQGSIIVKGKKVEDEQQVTEG